MSKITSGRTAKPTTAEEALKVAKGLKQKYPRMFEAMRAGKKTWGKSTYRTIAEGDPSKSKKYRTSRTKRTSKGLREAGVKERKIRKMED